MQPLLADAEVVRDLVDDGDGDLLDDLLGGRADVADRLAVHHDPVGQRAAVLPAALGQRVPLPVFEGLVADALDQVPPELMALVDNVVVLVADRNEDEPELLGLYEGYALTERGWDYGGALPDRIMIYRSAICDICDDEDQVVEEVTITVVHEIAHHFGIDDDRLHDLGYA